MEEGLQEHRPISPREAFPGIWTDGPIHLLRNRDSFSDKPVRVIRQRISEPLRLGPGAGTRILGQKAGRAQGVENPAAGGESRYPPQG